MTTTFLLVRHAAHDNVGAYLAGRLPNILLGPQGLAQAERLGQRMRRERFSTVVSSPRERTRQTAQAIAAARGGAEVEVDAELDEIDFGAWSGKTFDELDGDESWREWNSRRATARTPAGETMADVGRRVLACMEGLGRRFPEEAVVLVSHADVIKTAVLAHLGLPLDAGSRIEVSPASITALAVGDWGAKLWRLNETID